MKKTLFQKLEQDDIFSALVDSYRNNPEYRDYQSITFHFLGTSNYDLRCIVVLTNEEEPLNYDLQKIDAEMEYNGEHAFLRKNGFLFTPDKAREEAERYLSKTDIDEHNRLTTKTSFWPWSKRRKKGDK